mmetsp:Transcript_71662/g.149540  ORF Transcript_71662/g.149540 Transcript_71662/m.149540 type:complete len:213 (+) Transcript_71662:4506-5144(+)
MGDTFCKRRGRSRGRHSCLICKHNLTDQLSLLVTVCRSGTPRMSRPNRQRSAKSLICTCNFPLQFRQALILIIQGKVRSGRKDHSRCKSLCHTSSFEPLCSLRARMNSWGKECIAHLPRTNSLGIGKTIFRRRPGTILFHFHKICILHLLSHDIPHYRRKQQLQFGRWVIPGPQSQKLNPLCTSCSPQKSLCRYQLRTNSRQGLGDCMPKMS